MGRNFDKQEDRVKAVDVLTTGTKYIFTIEDCREEKETRFGEQILFTLTTEVEGELIEVIDWAKPFFSPNSKLGRIAEAVHGEVDSIDLDNFIGHQVEGLVVHQTSQRGARYVKIAKYFPVSKKGKKAKASKGQKKLPTTDEV